VLSDAVKNVRNADRICTWHDPTLIAFDYTTDMFNHFNESIGHWEILNYIVDVQ
jgi:hypothetical protein